MKWSRFGALVASRTSHGDTTVCLERVAFWLTFILCGSQWVQGRDIPASLASFLNVLVAAVLGQGVLSTVGLVTKRGCETNIAMAAQKASADSVSLPLAGSDHTLARNDN